MKEYSEKIKGINLLLAPILFFILSVVYSNRIGNTYINIYTKILIECVTILFILVYLYKIKDIDIKSLIKWKNLKYILISVVLLRIIAVGGTYLGEIIIHEERTANDMALINMINQLNGLMLIEFYFSKIIFGPIIEEYIFRYIIIGNLGKMSKISMIISSILFSLAHMSTNILHWMIYFLMGMVLAIIYKKTEKIETSMLVHILNNFIAFFRCI
ncbi:CPBP family intramembrane glutamic endopeptidase [Peptacetobacter sp.]|uniref:CPBP family intramembrane glutamic endopeptidase n=1 Tax=Peptacetobacter sp. TaxID=2991975 RepID=UPI002E7A32C1|nr:type II CAAX endopeptidase family protein [Peptacetobacter sp.]MEE0450758.1 type II CAAX endopeptidase family protein [Peptacetobacter sp.]